VPSGKGNVHQSALPKIRGGGEREREKKRKKERSTPEFIEKYVQESSRMLLRG
jgi:hypothetical protein